MTPVILVCAVFLTVGFAIKHTPTRRHRDPRNIKRRQDL